MAVVSHIDDHEAWLVDPYKKWIIHFYENINTSSHVSASVTLDMWGARSDGSPDKFKSRRKTTKTESIQIRSKLIKSGWRRLNHKIDCIEPQIQSI